MTSFIIAPDGRVQTAGIVEATLDDPALHECMLAVIRGLRFPPPAGGGVVGVNYPWVFSWSP